MLEKRTGGEKKKIDLGMTRMLMAKTVDLNAYTGGAVGWNGGGNGGCVGCKTRRSGQIVGQTQKQKKSKMHAERLRQLPVPVPSTRENYRSGSPCIGRSTPCAAYVI